MEFQLALDLWCTVLPISNLLDILTSGNDLEFITVSDCRLEKSPYRVAMPFYMRNHTHGSATSLQWMSNKSTASRLHNWTSCSHDEDAGVCTGARLRTSYMVDRTPTSNPRTEISQSTLAGNHRLSERYFSTFFMPCNHPPTTMRSYFQHIFLQPIFFFCCFIQYKWWSSF